MFFIAYAFKGQVHVFAGRVKIVSHLSCRTSAILNYFCPLRVNTLFFQNYRSAEEIVQDDEDTEDTSKSGRPSLEMLQQQLEQTNRLCQTLLGDQAASQMARLSVSGQCLET